MAWSKCGWRARTILGQFSRERDAMSPFPIISMDCILAVDALFAHAGEYMSGVVCNLATEPRAISNYVDSTVFFIFNTIIEHLFPRLGGSSYSFFLPPHKYVARPRSLSNNIKFPSSQLQIGQLMMHLRHFTWVV